MNVLIKWLKALFRWISLMLMIPLLLLVILLTPLGLKIGVAILGQVAPGELHYQQITGTLLGPLTIKKLSYRYQDQQISIDHLYLQWHLSELLADRIFIDNLNIDGLHINTPRAPAATAEFSLATVKQTLHDIRPQLTGLHLPFKLQINNANISDITWQQQPGEPTVQASGIRIWHLQLEPNILTVKMQGQFIKPYELQTQLTLTGAPQQYHFELQAFNPQAHWIINGQVNSEAITLDTQKALIFNGQLDVHLVWKWNEPMSWELNLSGQHLDFSLLQPDWPHPLDINLNTTGSLGATQPQFNWKLRVKTQHSLLETQGTHATQWDLQWNIQINQLAELLPFSSGSINSTGELHGAFPRPQTKGHLQAKLLRWQDYRLDKVDADWDLDVAETRSSFFKIASEQLFAPWMQIQALQINGNGKWEKHQLNATLQGYNVNLSTQVQGGLSGNQWQGSLQKLTITAPYVGVWNLTQPTGLFISPQRAAVTALCLHSVSQSQLCLRTQWKGDTNAWDIAATGRLDFQQVATLIPEEFTLNLPMDLHLTANGVGKEIQQAQLTASSPGGAIRYTGEQILQTQIKSTQFLAKLDATGAHIDARIELADNNIISASLQLPRATSTQIFSPAQILQGKINLDFSNLSPIQTLIPDIVSPRGKFHAHFTVSGTVGSPFINGETSVEGGQIKIPGLNIQLNQINLVFNAKGSELNYVLTATSANQPLRIVGKTHLNEANFPTELMLTGNTVLLADTPAYTAYVTPQARITIAGHNIDISGSVDIPKAVLRELKFQSEAALPEDEVVFVGEHPVAKRSPWNLTMQLTVNLGNDVKIDTPDLKGKLSGSLTLLAQPGQPLLGIGRIDIADGIYQVFGRALNITPGSGIVYRRNPLSNPSLNVQATTRVIVTDVVSQQQLGTNEITVGMSIGGTSSSPQVTLFSSAGNLSQADMLAYLLLGTSSAGISPTNMNLMLQALNNLPLTKHGASGVEGLTNQVKQSLGLTELGVTSEATYGPGGEALPSTATPTSYFVVGKRLTSRIYLRYKYDPFNSVNLFQLSYLFSTNWSLQLETDGSTQSGIDVLYTIQTGTAKSADKTTAQNK